MPFRKLDIDQTYPKYTWIEIDVVRNLKDFRPETYRPDLTNISVESRPKKVDWDRPEHIQKLYNDLFKQEYSRNTIEFWSAWFFPECTTSTKE